MGGISLLEEGRALERELVISIILYIYKWEVSRLRDEGRALEKELVITVIVYIYINGRYLGFGKRVEQ